MKFFDWLGRRTGLTKTTEYVILSDAEAKQAMQSLAFEICVQRIAKTIAKCEFRTYENHEEVQGSTYYRLNVRPNPNQSGTEFWQSFVERLYTEQEVLMIESRRNLYLADGFIKDETKAMKPHTFSKVQIGTLTLDKTFSMEDVGYFQLSNKKVKDLLSDTMRTYSKLTDDAIKAYRNGVGMKAKMHIGRQQQAMDEQVKKALLQGVEKFMNEPNACFMEYDGYDFQPFDTSRKGTQQSTRDIKAMMDDMLELTSKAFLIPSNIAAGEVTDTSKAVDDFLTFCLDSVIALLEDVLNHVLYGETGYLEGNRIKINAQTIKHIDILDAATSVDKLISCGAKSINDVRRITGDEPLKEEWADTHWITKNYSAINELNDALKGGDENEQNENADTGQGDEFQDEPEPENGDNSDS